MGETGNNVNFCFVDFAINKLKRIDTSSILIINKKIVVINYFFLSF